jgi:hypothetical protein
MGLSDGVVLHAGELALPVQTYEFRHVRDHATEDVIRIFNAFILPDGRVTRDINDIHRQSERLAVSVQGVAQLQVITAQDLPLAQAIEAADQLLGGMPDLFNALCVGQGDSRGKS